MYFYFSFVFAFKINKQQQHREVLIFIVAHSVYDKDDDVAVECQIKNDPFIHVPKTHIFKAIFYYIEYYR